MRPCFRRPFVACQGKINIENAYFYALIDSAADSLLNVLGDKAAGSNGAHAIINVVYETWKIGFDPCDTLVETLLPELVYAHKKGACLGVSLIILMLAEKLRCPIHGVLLPGHFFCRFDDGNVSFNIEPNNQDSNILTTIIGRDIYRAQTLGTI